MEFGLNHATLCVMVDEGTLSVTSGVGMTYFGGGVKFN